MRICRKCNSFIEDDMIFCPECGVKYLKFESQFYAAPNFPIAVAEQCIFIDEGSVLGSISLCNVGENEVTACAVKIKCLDSFGDELADCVVKYIDLMADYGDFFGEDKVFTFSDNDTRQIQIVIDKVLFADGTMIKGEGIEFSPTNEYDELKNYLEASKEDIIRDQEAERMWEELLDWHTNHSETYSKACRDDPSLAEKLTLVKSKIIAKNPDFIIPSSVTEIPKGMFFTYNGTRSSLKSIFITDSVTKIGESAFDNCQNLADVKFSENLLTIGMYAFNGCISLKEIILPNSVTKIGWGAFAKCEKITNIYIPDSVISIDNSAFRNCKGLQNIRLSENISRLEPATFVRCGSLKSIVLPDSLRFIDKTAFYLSPKINSDGLPEYENGVMEIYASDSVIQLLKTVELPPECKILSKKEYEEKARREQEAQEAEARIEQYWAKHADEKQQFDTEKAKLDQAYAQLSKEINSTELEIDRLHRSLDDDVPQNIGKKNIQIEIDELYQQLSRLGIFKSKEKKALQGKIDELNSKIQTVDAAIEAAKKEREESANAQISDLQNDIKQLNERRNEIEKRLAEINAELTKPR